MADETIYTKDQLGAMSRLLLRRICKQRGMSSEGCSKTEFDAMVDWIIETQEGGTPKAKAKPATKAAATKAKASKAPARKAKAKAPVEDPEEALEGESGELAAKLDTLDGKIDTVGELMDKNNEQLIENINELRADVYKLTGLLRHLGAWMEDDQVLTPENAPDGLGFQEKEAEIDEECSGNE